MTAQRGPDLVEYDCCDYCHELPDGTEQLCAFGELGNLLLHPGCQARMLARYRTIGDPITDMNGDLIIPSTWSHSERSKRT
jgi:hypothetical protein